MENFIEGLRTRLEGLLPKKVVRIAAITFSVLLLLGVTSYGARNASNFFSTGSDALVYTYLVGGGARRHTIVLPDQHTNILKLPIFYIQSLFPYHYTNYIILSVSLVVITVFMWAYFLIKLFGKKYQIPILLIFAGLLFTSVVLNLNIAETTVRNIEFPIALWFIFTINKFLKNEKYTRLEIASAILSCGLFCLTLAGDNYFEYAISLPIVLVIFGYWLQSRNFTKRMVESFLLVFAVSGLGVLFKGFLNKVGIIVVDKTPNPFTIVTQHNFIPSVTTAILQLLNMQGADIFGRALSIRNFSVFMNFGVLLLGVLGLILILIRVGSNYRKHQTQISNKKDFIYITVAVSFFVTLAVYLLSGQVVSTLSNGQVVSLGQNRYIALLPFLVLIGLVWFFITYYEKQKVLLGIIALLSVIEIIFAYSSIKTAYAAAITNQQPTRETLSEIIGDLHQDNVTEVLASYWYSSPIQFWSNNTIDAASIINCNTPFNYNVREDWYRPTGVSKSALVINRPDPVYWGCNDRTIISIYGPPSRVQVVPGTMPGSYIDIWVYNYDVRNHLNAFPSGL